MKPIEVILIDDHTMVRAGIRSLIEQISEFAVVAEASSAAEALLKTAQALPAIALTDISMGDDNGLDLVRQLKQQFPAMAVMILSMHASEDLVAEALRLGASAYLVKEAAPAELEIALRAVLRRETYLSPAVSTKIIDRYVRQPLPPDNPLKALTGRQLQILTMIGARKGTKEIAYELDLSEKTVAAHRAQMMARVGVRDIVGLILLAVKHGLIKEED